MWGGRGILEMALSTGLLGNIQEELVLPISLLDPITAHGGEDVLSFYNRNVGVSLILSSRRAQLGALKLPQFRCS